MNHRTRSILFSLIAAGAALAFGSPAAWPSTGHRANQARQKPGGKHGRKTYAGPSPRSTGTWRASRNSSPPETRRCACRGQEGGGHRQHARRAWPLKPGSGVARKNVRDINKTAKDLAGKFDAIDKAGDSGDEAERQEGPRRDDRSSRPRSKYAPAEARPRSTPRFVLLPMHCEGPRLTTSPAKCPKVRHEPQKATTDKFSVAVKPRWRARSKRASPPRSRSRSKDPTGAVTRVETVHEEVAAPAHHLKKDLVVPPRAPAMVRRTARSRSTSRSPPA